MSWYPAPETDDEREERLRPEVSAQPVSVPERASTAMVIIDPQEKSEAAVDWKKLERLGWQQVLCPGCGGDYARARPAETVSRSNLLAKKHQGMRVNYSGLLGQCQTSLKRCGDTGNAEMLRQLQEHLKELGTRWYAGDTDVVDEILQLYCVESEARAALVSNSAKETNHGC